MRGLPCRAILPQTVRAVATLFTCLIALQFLAVTSHDLTQLNTSTFDTVAVTTGTGQPPAARRCKP